MVESWQRKDEGRAVRVCLARNSVDGGRRKCLLNHDAGAWLDLLSAVSDGVGYVLVHGELT